MRKIIYFIGINLLFLSQLLAINLADCNIYERSDRIDIMLSFDAPYNGQIKQLNEAGATILSLNNLYAKSDIEKMINSKIAQNILITQFDDNTMGIEIRSKSPVKIIASKTIDNFGLRIRIKSKILAKTNASSFKETSTIQTKKESQVSLWRYLIVIGILVFLIIILLIIKKKTSKKTNFNFSGKSTPLNSNNLFESNNVAVVYQKDLDTLNKVMLLEHLNKKYLVLVGSSNVLLDSFGEEKIQTQEDFEVFFEENKRKLNKYLEDRKNSLNNYKNALENS